MKQTMDGGSDSSGCGCSSGLQEGRTAKPNRKEGRGCGVRGFVSGLARIQSTIGSIKHQDLAKEIKKDCLQVQDANRQQIGATQQRVAFVVRLSRQQ